MEIMKNKPDNFIVLSGDDSLTLPMIYLGAEGVISVIGQSHPKHFSEMVSFALAGETFLATSFIISCMIFMSLFIKKGTL